MKYTFAVRFLCTPALLLLAGAVPVLRAETCTTQSALTPADRDHLASAARSLAQEVVSNNAAALRTSAAPDLAKDFGALQYLVAVTAPKLAQDVPVVEQVYLLDASNLKKNADGSNPDAQFFCSLNRTTMEAEFDIHALPPGKYAFAIVNLNPPSSSRTPTPWQLSFLLRQDSSTDPQAPWQLAGLYPHPLTAGGHDGLWFWPQGREMAKDKQPWNAWLDYQEAQKLLQPADFVLSTHLDKLHTEMTSAAPSALAEGINVDTPLIVKAADGTEYHFIGLNLDDSLNPDSIDVAAHLRADPLTDQAAARKRNDAAAAALLAAYPELRKPFHGVWIYAESPGQPPFATEQPMSDIK
jgi:hypothetical protein